MKNDKNKVTKEFSITAKRRWQDTITVGKKSSKVGWFMVFHPLALYRAVHTKGSRLSLTSDVHKILKEKIARDYPDELEQIERRKRLVESKRKFRSMQHQKSFQWIGKRDEQIKSS